MKRADGRKEQFDMTNIDAGELAEIVLNGAAVALRKRQPNLSEAQALAKIYEDPDYRIAVKAERASAHAKLEVPVAREAPKTLEDFDENEIRALAEEVQAANPFMSAAQLYRALADAIEERQSPPSKVRLATVDNRGHAKMLDEKVAELSKREPGLTPEQAFTRVYLDPANRELAMAERAANRP